MHPGPGEPNDRPDDVTSDPARDDETGSDWTTEGGATDAGPATDTSRDSDSPDETA